MSDDTRDMLINIIPQMWGYEERIKPILISLKSKYPSVKLIELQSDKEVEKVKNLMATLK